MKRLAFFTTPILAVLLLVGCQPETDVFDGPSLVDRFGEFRLTDSLTASAPTVDFSAGETVFFNASFSKRINWVLRITGESSGAVKLIEGFDNQLNVDNSRWDGTTTELPFFRAEDCLAELIIPEEDSLTLTTMVTVAGAREYAGNVFMDFEGNPGPRINIPSFVFQFSPNRGVTSDPPAGQGENFYFLEGTATPSVDPFFAGLIRIFPGAGQTYIDLPTTVPSNAYLNFFLWSDNTPHTIAVIALLVDSNDNGSYDDGTDQIIGIGDINIDFAGWRLFSSSLEAIGLSEEQAGKLVGIQVALISNNNTQPNPPLPVRYGIDYITFTSGGPLNP